MREFPKKIPTRWRANVVRGSLPCSRQPARWIHARSLSGWNRSTAPGYVVARQCGILSANVELEDVRPWLRLARPKVQRNSPAKRELIRYPRERGNPPIHAYLPRTAASSTSMRSSLPSARAGKLFSFRRSRPSLRRGTPETQFFICRRGR
jgi:hypothetical protein